MDNVPVYRMLADLRIGIIDATSQALRAVASNNFDEAEQLLIEARRQVLVLQTLTEE